MEVAYWRKANAIHRWFVDTCQDGNDDCRQSYVSREQLQKLLETCKAVLADRTKADELLPTQDGFFFGPTEYDHVYFADVADTATQLENVLELDDSWDFCYSSSW
jgi:hypothetical protein